MKETTLPEIKFCPEGKVELSYEAYHALPEVDGTVWDYLSAWGANWEDDHSIDGRMSELYKYYAMLRFHPSFRKQAKCMAAFLQAHNALLDAVRVNHLRPTEPEHEVAP